MKTLVTSVKNMSIKAKNALNTTDYLDYSLQNPLCLKLINQMNSIKLNEVGIE
jgi:hypothetical protein